MKKEALDLEKYMGTWHEINAFPQKFQDKCLPRTTTAEYTLKDEYVRVKNRCNTINWLGKEKSTTVKGKAFTTNDPFVLNVQFFFPFKSEYKIEHVEGNEDTYRHAIVGNTDKSTLWILSRNKDITDEKYNELISIAKEKGYDVSELKYPIL